MIGNSLQLLLAMQKLPNESSQQRRLRLRDSSPGPVRGPPRAPLAGRLGSSLKNEESRDEEHGTRAVGGAHEGMRKVAMVMEDLPRPQLISSRHCSRASSRTWAGNPKAEPELTRWNERGPLPSRPAGDAWRRRPAEDEDFAATRLGCCLMA